MGCDNQKYTHSSLKIYSLVKKRKRRKEKPQKTKTNEHQPIFTRWLTHSIQLRPGYNHFGFICIG